MALFVARLFYMQVIQHDRYVAEAKQEQVKSLVVKADRGEIYALDNGEPVKLVLNENVYTVFADPMEVKDPAAITKAVKEVAGGTAEKGIEKLVLDKPSRYRILAKNVTRKQAKLLQDKDLAGVGFQKTTRRIHPEGKLASQVLGFVNAEGVGQYGIEEGLNEELTGKDGLLKSVTDVRNVPLTVGGDNVRVPAEDGKNVVLSIDRNIQAFTEKTLFDEMKKIGATKGSVIVMDPQSGKVLSMANLPDYNPEKYTKVMNGEAFNNSVITAPYEPGSVIKTFTVATALDQGAITPTSRFNNTDSIKVEDIVIKNANLGITGNITMQEALSWSLNTGMVKIAQRLGDGENITHEARKTMYNYFHNKFKLGEATGIELAGERSGNIVSPDEAQGNAVRYSNMTFGQGMNPTMLQVAAGFSSIVNGGRYFKPPVVAGEVTSDGNFKPEENKLLDGNTISPESSATARKMIREARNQFYSDGDKKGYNIGGKTGTSETLVDDEYSEDQTVGTYLGYGGDTAPKYVIMVQASAPGKPLGGRDVEPIFKAISNWTIDYMKLQPKG